MSVAIYRGTLCGSPERNRLADCRIGDSECWRQTSICDRRAVIGRAGWSSNAEAQAPTPEPAGAMKGQHQPTRRESWAVALHSPFAPHAPCQRAPRRPPALTVPSLIEVHLYSARLAPARTRQPLIHLLPATSRPIHCPSRQSRRQ
jgi:hypothetical protein